MKIDLTKEEWGIVSNGLLAHAYEVIREQDGRNPMEMLKEFDKLRSLSTRIIGQVLAEAEEEE